MRKTLDHEFKFTPAPGRTMNTVPCEECGESALDHWCGCCLRDYEFRVELLAQLEAYRIALQEIADTCGDDGWRIASRALDLANAAK